MKNKKRTPAWIKAILKNRFIDAAIVTLAAFYIRLIWLTGRWQRQFHPEAQKLIDAGKPIILAFWHGRLLMMPYIWPHKHNMNVLISEHRDGMLISRTIARFHLSTISGSSSRKALSAVREIMKKLKNGESVTFTPDGPRGPRHKAAPGIVAVAAATGVPIVPSAFSASPARILSSWDAFMLPYPFCRGVIMAGKPFTLAKDELSEDSLCLEVETRMNNLQKQADNYINQC